MNLYCRTFCNIEHSLVAYHNPWKKLLNIMFCFSGIFLTFQFYSNIHVFLLISPRVMFLTWVVCVNTLISHHCDPSSILRISSGCMRGYYPTQKCGVSFHINDHFTPKSELTKSIDISCRTCLLIVVK